MRLKETYLNNDITEAWNEMEKQQVKEGKRGGGTVKVKKKRRGERDERELTLTMSR